jgi:hypothetical protein
VVESTELIGGVDTIPTKPSEPQKLENRIDSATWLRTIGAVEPSREN